MRRIPAGLMTALLLSVSSANGVVAQTPTWTLLPSPNRIVQHGQLQAVSCVSPASCMAVGSGSDSNGHQVLVGAAWNGSRWSAQPFAFPPTAVSGSLFGVSCASAAACVAVGSVQDASGQLALAEGWNGSAWTKLGNPSPAGGSDIYLLGVSCTSAVQCSAVGNYFDGTATQPLAESWDGSSWTFQPTPSSGSVRVLSGISCTSAANCEAVGSDTDPTGFPSQTLIEVWDGTTWTIQPSANPAGASYSSLGSVSCSSPVACMAVGFADVGTFAERWDGTSWAIVPTPNPSANANFDSVSCAAAAQCEAVGSYFTATSSFAFAESWDGSSWQLQAAPIPSGAAVVDLRSASCPRTTWCAAVGSFSTGTYYADLAETYVHGKWRLGPSFGVIGELPSGFLQVSCTASNACVAVGAAQIFFESLGSGPSMLAATWDGASWHLFEPPDPSRAVGGVLYGVSCVNASNCVAVGNASDFPVAESWNGRRWRADRLPVPSGSSFAQLGGVSCVAATMCTAVGQVFDGTANRPLIDLLRGNKWAVQAPALPVGAANAILSGVSCASSTACMAVGNYGLDDGTTMALAEQWDGINWAQATIPAPAGATFATLSGVSCISSTACIAVGNYSPDGGITTVTLADSWDGTTWTELASPNPAGEPYASLESVSCTAASACMSTGHSSDPNGVASSLAETWDGTGWSLASPPNPPGATGSTLHGVSCTSATTCMAVGLYPGASVNEKTLTEMSS